MAPNANLNFTKSLNASFLIQNVGTVSRAKGTHCSEDAMNIVSTLTS